MGLWVAPVAPRFPWGILLPLFSSRVFPTWTPASGAEAPGSNSLLSLFRSRGEPQSRSCSSRPPRSFTGSVPGAPLLFGALSHLKALASVARTQSPRETCPCHKLQGSSARLCSPRGRRLPAVNEQRFIYVPSRGRFYTNGPASTAGNEFPPFADICHPGLSHPKS